MNANEPKPPSLNAPRADRVLPTLNADGTRRWVRPRLSPGRFLNARRVVGWLLIAIFVAAPWIQVGGRPLFLLDIPGRRFIVFAAEFRPTDTFFLMLLMLAIFLSIFWVTALVGRVWCGWGCPQTVYMELVFRPIERLFEGSPGHQRAEDRKGWFTPKRLAKYAVFALLSVALANVFLAYFVGAETVLAWMTRAPWEHPVGFSVVAITSGLMFFDFAYFRDQMCTVVCPYARLQSVLLDKDSLIVGYDEKRGEPRGKKRDREGGAALGDCIDCHACVQTCPTGIDIRQGLQLECVGCAQCVDACDAIMVRIGKPKGLIRYSAQSVLESPGTKAKVLRARTILYPLIILGLVIALVLGLGAQTDADVTVLRGLDTPFTEEAGGLIRNQLRVKVANRADAARSFTLSAPALSAEELLAPQNPLLVGPKDTVTTPVFITVPRSRFSRGELAVDIHVSDGQGFERITRFRLMGPRD